LTKTLKSSLLCPEGAALFNRRPPHFSTAVYNSLKNLNIMPCPSSLNNPSPVSGNAAAATADQNWYD